MNAKVLDPRTKFAMVLLLSSMGLVYSDIWRLTLVMVLTGAIASSLSRDLLMAIKGLKRVLGAVIIIALIQSVLIQTGNPLIQVYGLTLVTDYGLMKATEFTLRMVIMLFAAVILMSSTSRQIVQGLIQMGMPYEIAFMVSIGIRFLPVFKEEMTDAVIALQLRGVDLNQVRWKQKIQVYQYLLQPVLTGALQKARALAVSMEVRGFRVYPMRTNYRTLKLRSVDYLIIGVSLLALISVFLP